MEFLKEKEYVGDLRQLMPYKVYTLSGGRMDGVRAVDISNGADIEITILPDRCMDIYSLRVGGKSLNFLTQAGITHPAYYQGGSMDWLKAFSGGFLTTCGLKNIGSPSAYNGKEYGLHGTISTSPAENFSINLEQDALGPVITLTGTVNETELFGGILSLTRTFRIRYGSEEIEMTDRIQNNGFKQQFYMILYHYNMGYPLLSEHAKLELDSAEMRPRDSHAEKYADKWQEIWPPADSFREMCYYHSLRTDGGQVPLRRAAISNPVTGLRAEIKYQSAHLDHFVQWKLFEKGTYVMGLEPCNATIDGVADAAENKSLKSLEPGEFTENKFVITAGFTDKN